MGWLGSQELEFQVKFHGYFVFLQSGSGWRASPRWRVDCHTPQADDRRQRYDGDTVMVSRLIFISRSSLEWWFGNFKWMTGVNVWLIIYVTYFLFGFTILRRCIRERHTEKDSIIFIHFFKITINIFTTIVTLDDFYFPLKLIVYVSSEFLKTWI